MALAASLALVWLVSCSVRDTVVSAPPASSGPSVDPTLRAASSGPSVDPTLRAAASATAATASPASPASANSTRGGELVTLKGVRLLRLTGTPRERGYAHGYLLAPRIIAVFRLYRPFLATDQAYENGVRPEVRDRFRFPSDVADELAGMYEGMRAFFRERDGDEDALVLGIGRPLDELDLRCMQAIPDWYLFHCSAFVAWGALAPEGPVVGRNMDFGYHPVLTANHLLIYRDRQVERPARAAADRRAWVSLTFPGIVGAITGVNEDGVAVFTLDSNAPRLDLKDLIEAGGADRNMLPRLLALRRILEEAGPEDPVHDAMKLLDGVPTRWGQNIFIAGPGVAGVIERTVRKTVLRTAADDPVAAGVPAFACTNHFRRLVEPEQCWRYRTIVERMKELQTAGRTLDEKEAFRLLWDVKQKYLTMQSVVVDLRRREISLRLFREPLLVMKPRVVRFSWKEIAGEARPAGSRSTP